MNLSARVFVVQSDIRDIVNLIPNLCNKANIAIKQVTSFWSPSAYKSCLHYSVVYEVCTNIMSKKPNVHTIIKSTLLVRYLNHHLRLQ